MVFIIGFSVCSFLYLDEKDVSLVMDSAELYSIMHYQTHVILTWFDIMNLCYEKI